MFMQVQSYKKIPDTSHFFIFFSYICGDER